jgi:hypothetical protein
MCSTALLRSQQPRTVKFNQNVQSPSGALRRASAIMPDGAIMTHEGLELIREIVLHGGAKYTAGNIDRSKYQRLVDLGWLSPLIMNKTDIAYETTKAGEVAAS